MVGIYTITNKINNKKYIGQSQNIKVRWKNHKAELRHNHHNNTYLQNSWNKYGEHNFEFKIIEECNIEKLDEKEMYWIEFYNTVDPECGYNLNNGGGSNRGIKFSEETKRKMSEVRKGKRVVKKTDILTPELVKNIKIDLINGMSIKDASVKYDVTYNSVNGLISNNTWSNIEVEGWEDFLQNRNKTYRLTKEDHENIKSLNKQGMSKYELADMYNKNVKTIEWILRKK